MRYGRTTAISSARTANVLTGTPFAQLSAGAVVRIRAKAIVNTLDYNAASVTCELDIGSLQLVSSKIRSQLGGALAVVGKTGASSAPATVQQIKVDTADVDQAGIGVGALAGTNVGLDDCDEVYAGIAGPGSLSLTFDPSAALPASSHILWDIAI